MQFLAVSLCIDASLLAHEFQHAVDFRPGLGRGAAASILRSGSRGGLLWRGVLAGRAECAGGLLLQALEDLLVFLGEAWGCGSGGPACEGWEGLAEVPA